MQHLTMIRAPAPAVVMLSVATVSPRYGMSRSKVIEVLDESDQGWEDAAKQVIANASKTARNSKSIYVENFEATIGSGQIKRYRINAKSSFLLD